MVTLYPVVFREAPLTFKRQSSIFHLDLNMAWITSGASAWKINSLSVSKMSTGGLHGCDWLSAASNRFTVSLKDHIAAGKSFKLLNLATWMSNLST